MFSLPSFFRRPKAPDPETKAMNSVPQAAGSGWVRILESFPGAWQTNTELPYNNLLGNAAVFACMSLISGDVGKLRVKLLRQRADGSWKEVIRNSPFLPVLAKPNGYQTRNQFFETWMLSKLARGNTYSLKERDGRGVVTALHILDPNKVQPLVSDDGSVFYQLGTSDLAGIEEAITVPASEILHDRGACLFHPLIGVSPIFAAALAATQGIQIQRNSATFFGNASRPSGVLTAPGAISNETAERLQAKWQSNFSGENAGRIAVMGDGLKFEGMTINAEDAQLIEQLRWSAETIAGTFGVPAYKIGVGEPPNRSIEQLNLEYYASAIQRHLEAIESLLDDGLGLRAAGLGVEFDTDALLRMDFKSQAEALKIAVTGALMSPNEARAALGLPPVAGGSTPYLQQQNFSLEALARRDAQDDPFGSEATPIAEE